MRGFLSIDSKFYKYLSVFADLIILTIIWTICSLPIITVGAATTGMYYVLTRLLSDREGYITKDFFKSFRQNFIQATFLTIMFLAAGWLVYFNVTHLQTSSMLLPVQFVLCYEIIITMIYVFPLLSRFEMKTFQLVRTACFMANRHLLTTFTCIILFIALVAVCFYQPMLIVICAGVYGWLTSLMFMKLFRKYLPDMDRDIEHTNAEIAAMQEAEKNAENDLNNEDIQGLL